MTEKTTRELSPPNKSIVSEYADDEEYERALEQRRAEVRDDIARVATERARRLARHRRALRFTREIAGGFGEDLDPEWRNQAVCATLPKEKRDLFTQDIHEGSSRTAWTAKQICKTCPVVAECLHDALMSGDISCIRGGVGPDILGRVARKL